MSQIIVVHICNAMILVFFYALLGCDCFGEKPKQYDVIAISELFSSDVLWAPTLHSLKAGCITFQCKL